MILTALDVHLESYISTGYVVKIEHLWHNDIYYTAKKYINIKHYFILIYTHIPQGEKYIIFNIEYLMSFFTLSECTY